MTSVIRGDDNFDSAGIVDGAAKAWVNFDGTTNTGGNCDIRASFNVSSVADNGTGNYTVNFETAMSDANYSISCSTSALTGITHRVHYVPQGADGGPTTTTLQGDTRRTDTNANVDLSHVHIQVFR